MLKRGRPTSAHPRVPIGVSLSPELAQALDEEVLRRKGLALKGQLHPSRASRTAVLAEALETKLRHRLRLR